MYFYRNKRNRTIHLSYVKCDVVRLKISMQDFVFVFVSLALIIWYNLDFGVLENVASCGGFAA